VLSILCFGDSNTWGLEASSGARLGRWRRWPGVLQRELGDDAYIIEEGLSDRTTVFEMPGLPYRSGAAALPMLLETHDPLDLVIIALGTNDLWVPGTTARDAARGVRCLIDLVGRTPVEAGDTPRMLVVIPPPLAALGEEWTDESQALVRESSGFGAAFRDILGPRDVPLVDLGELITTSASDGIHFEAADHEVIGRALAAAVQTLLGQPA